MIVLIRNEVMKLLYKKKMLLIILLLIIFIGLFSYGEKYAYDKSIERFEEVSEELDFDWKILANQQLDELYERLDNPYFTENGVKTVEIEIKQLQYFIDNDINPITPSAAKFSVTFVEQGITMFIPLLIVILAADIISGEFSSKTIKVLLTRAIPRWKILISKYIALLIMTTFVNLIVAIIALVVSYIFFGRWGFMEPIATGFSSIEGILNTNHVILITRFQYIILAYSLAWFVSIIMATITMMISVLVKNTGSAIGVLMATLIGGQFLQFFLGEWDLVKYFFVTNLNLTRYLTGSFARVDGMSLNFSIIVLLIWATLSLVVSFLVFKHKDVLV